MIHHDAPTHTAWYVAVSADNKPISYGTTRHPFQTRRCGPWGAGYWAIADMRGNGCITSSTKYTCAEEAMRAADLMAETAEHDADLEAECYTHHASLETD